MPTSYSIPEIITAKYAQGTEHVQYVMPPMHFSALEYMVRIKDPKALKSWLCYILGREFDAPRCSFFNMKDDNGRLIVTLGFDDPWYMSETTYHKYREHGTLPNPSE